MVNEIKPLQSKIDKQPSNIEAEQALLGSVLVNNDIIDEISTIVSSSIFYDPAHVKIYEVIESLNNKGMIANPITLKKHSLLLMRRSLGAATLILETSRGVLTHQNALKLGIGGTLVFIIF